MKTTIRLWDETHGWVHAVQVNGVSIEQSKHLDELQERHTDATPSGAVVCGDTIYPERTPFS